MKKILMCDPEFFDVNYEINSWMSTKNKANSTKARKQWDQMLSCVVKSGAQIRYIQPDPQFPDMVFTANAGLIRGNKVVLSNYRHPERQGERELFRRWFLDHGYQVIELPSHIYFEGAGDALFLDDILFIGDGLRTDKQAHHLIAEALEVDYVSCKLIDPYFYHLDTCLFMTHNQFVYYEKAFSQLALSTMLMKVVDYVTKSGTSVNIIPVKSHQAMQFICNSIKINHNIITPAHDYYEVFLGWGASVMRCDMSEFIKAGGAVKCLTLEL
tara:strand:- start:1671 stop:2480 length:810 start_codon:yes stop_codon:yes gene_type:complete